MMTSQGESMNLSSATRLSPLYLKKFSMVEMGEKADESIEDMFDWG